MVMTRRPRSLFRNRGTFRQAGRLGGLALAVLLIAGACSDISDSGSDSAQGAVDRPGGSVTNGVSHPVDELVGGWTPADGYIAVDPGDLFVCALRTDRRVVCWGDGSDGKTKAPEGEFKELATGHHYACAIRLGGEVPAGEEEKTSHHRRKGNSSLLT